MTGPEDAATGLALKYPVVSPQKPRSVGQEVGQGSLRCKAVKIEGVSGRLSFFRLNILFLSPSLVRRLLPLIC